MLSSRAEAQAAGDKFYCTGKPCRHGHLSKRYTQNAFCHACHLERSKEWRAQNNDYCLNYQRDYYIKHCEEKRAQAILAYHNDCLPSMLKTARARAKKNNWEFSISTEDIGEIPSRCPIFDWIILETGHGKLGDRSPTIDRIDSSKGYVPGNVWIISWRANRIKADGSAKEHRLIARAVERKLAA